jgi:hypothetical protein
MTVPFAPSELSIHLTVVHRLKQDIQPGWLFFHTPNGELRNDQRAVSKCKAMGMLPGASDLIVFSPTGRAHFLEFKAATGTLSPAQEDFRVWAVGAGIPYAVARSVDEALRAFEFWGCIPPLQESGSDGPIQNTKDY